MSVTVLLVDDSRYMRTMMSNALLEGGYEVVAEADNGQSAIELHLGLRPDVTFLDITMPVMDGLAALKEIKEMDPMAIVIMCTAISSQRQVMEAACSGADRYIVKPFSPDQVRDVIAEFMPQIERRREALRAAAAGHLSAAAAGADAALADPTVT